MKQLKVGLIGFGAGGRVFHAPIIHSVDGLHLYKIRETKKENIEIANQRYPLAKIVNDSKDIFYDEAVDLVVIVTPNTLHFPLAKEALLAGKNVVVDKPFTISSQEADELISISKQVGKVLTVHHNRRYDSGVKTVKKVLESKMLGNIVEFEVHYDRFRNYLRKDAWREEDIPGAGILYDLGSHLIDQVQWLFGMPKEITADVRIQRQGGKSTDNFELIFHYPDLKVTLKSGMLVKEPGPSTIILGDQGSFIKYGLDVQEEALKAGFTPLDTPDWGKEPESIWGKINTEYKGLHFVGHIESEIGDYRGFYENVYKTIIGEEDLFVTPEQARNTIRLIELSIQSSKEKKTISVA